MSEHAVVVIGAGPAGLATAVTLRREGVPAVVLERADTVAASWRGRYDRLRLNTSRWTARLPAARWPSGTPLFPRRDDVVRYLEDYARDLDLRFGVAVDRIDRDGDGWALTTSAGRLTAREVVVATGHQHTPLIPAWPGRDAFAGRLLHAAEYRNAAPFRGQDVLVAGPGCSGMEIAYDLAEGGAARVRLAVRTQPNIVLRKAGPLPGELIARQIVRLPPRIGDAPLGLVRRLAIGDLRPYGLTPPAEGLCARQRREEKAPAIVDPEVIAAIKARRIEIVAAVEGLDATGVRLADGAHVAVDAVVAATGYGTGLDPVVGHLGVLDARGRPVVHGGPAAAPGLRFIGYRQGPSLFPDMGREARRIAPAVREELRAGGYAAAASSERQALQIQ